MSLSRRPASARGARCRRWPWLAVPAVALVLAACQPAASPTPTRPPAPTVAPRATATPDPADLIPYRARSPEYGAHVFVWGHPDTTARDLGLLKKLDFGWQKSLFQWRLIEGECKGCFDWAEADRVVKASADAGLKIIARVDFQPSWARKDGAHNGPPDNYQDYADFIRALVDRYRTGSPHGRIHAVEIWNEVNLSREWGNEPINKQQAADYVRLLKLAYQAAKAVDPNVTIISAGLSPTGWNDDTARPDDVYLQWLYEEGFGKYFDVLGVHANSQAPEPTLEIGSWKGCDGGKNYCEHGSFYFRRVEQLRDIMLRHGESYKQIWLLEFGWTSDNVHPQYSWYATSEEQKGENLVRAFRYAAQNWAPWIGVMSVWTLPDPTWKENREEWWWAITNSDGTPRPAYGELLRAREKGLLP